MRGDFWFRVRESGQKRCLRERGRSSQDQDGPDNLKTQRPINWVLDRQQLMLVTGAKTKNSQNILHFLLWVFNWALRRCTPPRADSINVNTTHNFINKHNSKIDLSASWREIWVNLCFYLARLRDSVIYTKPSLRPWCEMTFGNNGTVMVGFRREGCYKSWHWCGTRPAGIFCHREYRLMRVSLRKTAAPPTLCN